MHRFISSINFLKDLIFTRPNDLLPILEDEKLDEREKLEILQNAPVIFTSHKFCTELLHVCAKNNYLRIAEWLIQDKKQTFDFESANLAAKYGYLEMLKYTYLFAEKGNYAPSEKRKTLHIAINFGHIHIIKWLLEKDVIPNKFDIYWATKCQEIIYSHKADDVHKARDKYYPHEDVKLMPAIETMIQITGLIEPEKKYEYQYRCYQKKLNNAPMTKGEKTAASDYLRVAEEMKKALDKAAPNENFPEDLLSEILEYSMGVKSKELPRPELKLEVEEEESMKSKLQSLNF